MCVCKGIKNLHVVDKIQTQRRGPWGRSGTRNGSKRSSQRQKVPEQKGSKRDTMWKPDKACGGNGGVHYSVCNTFQNVLEICIIKIKLNRWNTQRPQRSVTALITNINSPQEMSMGESLPAVATSMPHEDMSWRGLWSWLIQSQLDNRKFTVQKNVVLQLW